MHLHFDEDGLLLPGDYLMTLEELTSSILVVGPPDRDPDWDASHRASLVRNLAVLAKQLWSVGITEIYIDGSFCEDKNHPNDIDGYFVCDRRQIISEELPNRLNAMDDVWRWGDQYLRQDPMTGEFHLPMWHRYQVQLFAEIGEPCGIPDRDGKPQTFSQAFRHSRNDFKPRGIVKLLGGSP
jgi:hypothetical protein